MFPNLTLLQPRLMHNVESVLGSCLAGMGQYDEAEPLLLESYEILRNDATAPNIRVRQSLQRIVEFYEATNKPDLAAQWRSKLEGQR